jgi:DNA primase
MGKTYIETIKYLIIADFQVKGLVERPDVIGAVFGQSEGLLGSELDIKELQQNGKIGRIEIEYTHSNNLTTGVLKLPCSVSMVETAIVAASIETIEKVGPCDAFFSVKQIEDTRGLKRKQIKDRAIDLLGRLMHEQIPDTRELMDEIVDTFKTKDIVTIGPDKLAAGPGAKSSKEIIIVEGRADVLNLLKYGITNTIATGGARIPRSLSDLCRNRSITLFLDGDHGADIQQYQLMRSIKIDYIARAPDGKEVEELTQKEINQALRKKIKASNINARSGKIKQESIIKKTKFSTTNEHKVVPKIFQDAKEKASTTYFKSTNDFKKKEEDSFDHMLSEIPNLERVDVDKRSNDFSSKRSNDFSSKRSNDFSSKRSNDFSSKNNYSLPNKQNNDRKSMSIKEKIEQRVASIKNKEASKTLDNKVFEEKKEPKETIDKQQESKRNLEKQQELKETTEKPKPKENLEKPKEPVVKKKELPKLTEELKKNLSKITEDLKKTNYSRILNEKLRRIGACKTNDLEKKLKNFKNNKGFAIVTTKELTDDLLKIAIKKGFSFIVTKDAKQKSSDINILTYKDL